MHVAARLAGQDQEREEVLAVAVADRAREGGVDERVQVRRGRVRVLRRACEVHACGDLVELDGEFEVGAGAVWGGGGRQGGEGGDVAHAVLEGAQLGEVGDGVASGIAGVEEDGADFGEQV